MGMPAEITEWTADMARALPDDGNRYEVLDGELFVSPAPNLPHQAMVVELAVLLRAYAKANEIGRLYVSPADVQFSSRRLLQPDLFVAPLVHGMPPRAWSDIKRLLLVIEVASSSTVKVDRGRKRKIYLEEEVPQYWIVHTDARLVECWRPGMEQPQIVDAVLSWRPTAAVAALEIDLEALFDDVMG
jgi:Uma2 family endonuclease